MESEYMNMIDLLNSWLFKLTSISFTFVYIYFTYIVPKHLENVKSQKNNIKIKDFKEEVSLIEDGSEIGLPENLNDIVSKQPEWLNIDKLRKGQEVARKYYSVVNFSNYISMIMLLSHKKSVQTLIQTEKQNTIDDSGKRWLSTIHHVRNWYDYDLLDKNSKAMKSIRIVNKYHKHASKNMNGKTIEQNEIATKEKIDKVPYENNNYRHYIINSIVKTEAGLEQTDLEKDNLGPHLNQNQMLGTQWSFVGLLYLYPEKFGMKHGDELESFIYLWRYIGYLMGVEDKYNICDGNCKRKFEAFLEFGCKPLMREADNYWEHLVGCMTKGLNNYFYIFPPELVLTWLLDVLDLNYSGFYKELSLFQKVRLHLLKLIFKYQSFTPIRLFSNQFLRTVLNRFADMTNKTEKVHNLVL